MAEALPDYFSLFHLQPRFELDSAELAQRYRDIQNQVHPDRFADQPAQQQRLAVQQAAYVNEAYQCLRQPLARAKYLLALLQPQLASVQTVFDHGFLMEQMELREQLEALSTASVEKLETFRAGIMQRCKQAEAEFLRELNGKHYEQANIAFAKWQFLDKLLHEAEFFLGQQD